jgi:hypothetical protein
VLTHTGGEATDPDGYIVSIDGEPVQAAGIASNGSLTVSGLPVGNHSLELSGIAANCSVTGFNPTSVVVTADQSVDAVFDVDCPAWAVLQLTVTTSGKSLDPDGYRLQVDRESPEPIGANATLTLERAAGLHTLTLSEMATNCSLQAANPTPVTLTSGDTTHLTLKVICISPGAGRIVVTTHPSGIFSDPDGYTVTLDGSGGRHIGIDSTVTFPSVPSGVHSVKLSNLAPGCGFWLTNPKTVSVTAGATSTVRFDVICIP